MMSAPDEIPMGPADRPIFSNTTSLNDTLVNTPLPSGINWANICTNPLVEPLISEPCETLTSPDGYTLTPERVLK